MATRENFFKGITFRSVALSLFGMILMALMAFFIEGVAIKSDGFEFGSHSIPLPAMIVFVPFLIVAGASLALARVRFITKPELVCALFIMFIALPLMGKGFWYQMVGTIATPPKRADFEKYTFMNDKMWPHGENLLENQVGEASSEAHVKIGNVSWEEVEYDEGVSTILPVISNSSPNETSALRIKVPLKKDGEPFLIPGEPYFISALIQAKNLGADARYFCRVYYDEQEEFSEETFTSSAKGEKSYLFKKAFMPYGMYGLIIPAAVKKYIYVEFGLLGKGTITLYNPKLLNVEALESVYVGRKIISESAYNQIPENERGGLIVKPDNMWSLKGLQFFVCGYIPVSDWIKPVTMYGAFIVLLLAATFAVAVIMRKQWIDNERYPLPMTRIPVALLGEDATEDVPFSDIWKNRIMWMGFGIGLFWCLMKIWALYNNAVPNMNISVPLKPYFSDPRFGKMWQGLIVKITTFSVSAIFLSIAIFMELNVLMSLVLGFFLFRCQYWFGESTGWAVDNLYPYPDKQMLSAYLVYGILIVFFTRKYLWKTLKTAFRAKSAKDKSATQEEASGEIFSYRTAFLIIVFSFIGTIVLSLWLDIPPGGMVVFFGFLLLTGFVAAKLRAECGLPFSFFSVWKTMLILEILGGMMVFNPKSILFACFIGIIITQTTFCLLPGIQLEFIEIGRRFKVKAGHIALGCAIGILGGIVIGGGVFLSVSDALGGENIASAGFFGAKAGPLKVFSDMRNEADKVYLAEKEEDSSSKTKITPSTWAYVYGGVLTALVAMLRQLFAGFWFHPIGILVGCSRMMEYVWGSCLLAFCIRGLVLKLGGAVSVRTRLLPFFVGFFLAAIAAYVVLFLVTGYMYYFIPGEDRFGIIL